MTKLDVLDGFERSAGLRRVPLGGGDVREFPADLGCGVHAEPMYETMRGLDGADERRPSISTSCRPRRAKLRASRLEELVGVPAA